SDAVLTAVPAAPEASSEGEADVSEGAEGGSAEGAPEDVPEDAEDAEEDAPEDASGEASDELAGVTRGRLTADDESGAVLVSEEVTIPAGTTMRVPLPEATAAVELIPTLTAGVSN